jgi:hypothetical protein
MNACELTKQRGNAVGNRDEYLVLDLDTASVYPSTIARQVSLVGAKAEELDGQWMIQR